MRARPFAARSGSWPMLAAAVLIASCGCESVPAPPPPPDHDAAKQTLLRALSSWQKGETVEGMGKASPSIRVSEPKWEGGDKLTKFEVQGSGKPRGDQQSFQVTLWLTSAKGRSTKEVAEYLVSINPVESVTRLMFD
jgi:hypothetical protein